MLNTLRILKLKVISLQSLIVLSISLYYFIAGALIEANPSSLVNIKTIFSAIILSLFSIFFALNHRSITKLLLTRNSLLFIILWITLMLIIQQPSLLFILILVLTFYDKNYKTMTGYLFIWLTVLFLVFTVLSTIGLINSGETLKSNLLVDSSEYQTVTSLGMGNPNTSMAFLLGIIMSGAYIYYDTKYKQKYGIIMLISSLFVYSLVGSRTGLISAILFLLLYLIDSRKFYTYIKFLMPIVLIIIMVISIIIGYKYGQTDNTVNSFLTTRPYNWHLRLDNGALTNLIGNSDQFYTIPGDRSERYPLDNQYIYSLARYGWVTIFLTFYLYVRGTQKIKSPVVIYMIFTSIMQCFVESLMFMAITNIGLVFILSTLILNENNKIQE